MSNFLLQVLLSCFCFIVCYCLLLFVPTDLVAYNEKFEGQHTWKSKDRIVFVCLCHILAARSAIGPYMHLFLFIEFFRGIVAWTRTLNGTKKRQ